MASNFELQAQANIGKTSVAFLCTANNLLDTCYSLFLSDGVYSKLMKKLGKYVTALNNPYLCINPVEMANLVAVGNVPGSRSYEETKSFESRLTSISPNVANLLTTLAAGQSTQTSTNRALPVIEKLVSADTLIGTYSQCSDNVEKPVEITLDDWIDYARQPHFIYLSPKNLITSSSLNFNCDNFTEPCSPNIELYNFLTIGTCYYETVSEPLFVVRYYYTNPSIKWPLLQMNTFGTDSILETSWVKIDRVLYNSHSAFTGTGLIGTLAYEGFSSPPDGGSEIDSSEDKISITLSSAITETQEEIANIQTRVETTITPNDEQIKLDDVRRNCSLRTFKDAAKKFSSPEAFLFELKRKDRIEFYHLIHRLAHLLRTDNEAIHMFNLNSHCSLLNRILCFDDLLIERLRYLAESSECNIKSYAAISESGNLTHKKLDLFDMLVAQLNLQCFIETLGPLWNKVVPGEAILAGGFTAAMLISLEKATLNYVLYSYIARGNKESDIVSQGSFLGYSTGALAFTLDVNKQYMLPRLRMSTRHDNRNKWYIVMDFTKCNLVIDGESVVVNFVVRNTLPNDELERMTFIFMYDPDTYWRTINGKTSHFICAVPTRTLISTVEKELESDAICNFKGYALKKCEQWIDDDLGKVIKNLLDNGIISTEDIRAGLVNDFS